MWLDELQRFLDGPYLLTSDSEPITAAAVRHLLDAPTPVSCSEPCGPSTPGSYAPQNLTLARLSGQRPRYPGAADILGDGRVRQESLTSFSRTEREAADKLSSNDPRLATALADPHYNVTEVLAGAPQLIARYEQASEEQQAVLNAAIDACRLGIQAPLTETLLRAAARSYLSTVHPDDTWLLPALAELTRHHRAAAPLIPVLNEERDKILGYTVADYLVQHVGRERRYARVAASTWDALISHIPDPADAARLADSARRRLLYCYAIPLYRHAADAGDGDAAFWLAELMTQRGDLDEAEQVLRARADAGGRDGALLLAILLYERGDLDGAEQVLRARADAGDAFAAGLLAALLAERGDLDGLRARADTGDAFAARQLATLLAERGDLDGLRARADAGDRHAARQLADPRDLVVVHDRRNFDHALDTLRRAWLRRTRADAGHGDAASRLAELLASDLDELRARADVGDAGAAELLAASDLDGLRTRADVGDAGAAELLAGLLAERGDLDGLRARADAGEGDAVALQLAWLLTKQGRVKKGEEAEQLRRFGLNPDGSIAHA